MEKEDLIVNLLREVRADQKVSANDISEIKIDVALNRQDLENHMLQTNLVKQMNIDTNIHFDKRIELIETKLSITYLLKLTVTVASGIGIVSGAIYGVIKLIQSF